MFQCQNYIPQHSTIQFKYEYRINTLKYFVSYLISSTYIKNNVVNKIYKTLMLLLLSYKYKLIF